MRSIKRAGHAFRVVDARYNGWDFWEAFAGGAWERDTLAEVAALQPGDLLFDVGAWVGPISLWAAAHGIRSIAIEPDPQALDHLTKNVEASGFADLITIVGKAIVAEPGLATLNIQNGGGDSQSSMARTNMFDSIEVDGVTLESLLAEHGTPALIKVDVEGFEGVVVPAFGPTLRALGVPMLLGLHWGWIPDGTREALEDELGRWTSRAIDNDAVFMTP